MIVINSLVSSTVPILAKSDDSGLWILFLIGIILFFLWHSNQKEEQSRARGLTRKREEEPRRGKARYPDFLTARNCVVLVSDDVQCSHGHHLSGKTVSILVLTQDGSPRKVTFESGVCPECQGTLRYFIPKATWNRLKSFGIPICRQSTAVDPDDWPIESLLHQLGYNVGQTDNLSTEFRRNILKLVICSHIYEKRHLEGFLRTRISLASGSQSRDMSTAIQRWESDLLWLQNNTFFEDVTSITSAIIPSTGHYC